MGTGVEAWAVPAALGAVGLMQSSDAQASANKQANKATKLQEKQFNEAYKQYVGYNPATEDRASIDQAKKDATASIVNAIKQINAEYGLAGGVPGNSTAPAVNTSRAVSETAGSLASMIAQLKSTETQRKAELLGVANSSAGNLATAYFNNAQRIMSTMPSSSGSISLLAQGIQKAFGGNSGTPQIQSQTPYSYQKSNSYGTNQIQSQTPYSYQKSNSYGTNLGKGDQLSILN